MIVRIIVSLAYLVLFGTGLAHAAGGPTVAGVAAHLLSSSRPVIPTLELIRSTGASSFRDDAPWSSVEKHAGVMQIPHRWDEIVDQANALGLDPLLILDYGNQLYDGGDKPTSKEGTDAFVRYAKFVVQHFRGRVRRFELWNEWDGSAGNTSRGSAESYIRFISLVYPELKRTYPEVEFLSGSFTAEAFSNGFFRRALSLGLLKYGDALALHTYVHCARQSSPSAWANLLVSIERDVKWASGATRRYYVTEMGWPSHRGSCGVSEQTQGKYLAEMLELSKQFPMLAGIWWYDLQNDGPDPTDREQNFGLLSHNSIPKPSFHAMRDFNQARTQGRAR